QATLAPVAFMTTMLPCIYVVGTLVPMLLRTIDLRLPFRRASTRLAVANLRREPRRTGVMAISLGFAMGMGFIVASLNKAIVQEVSESITANLDGIEVAALEPNNTVNIDARLRPEDLKLLRRLPEVGAIQRQMFVVSGNEPGDLIGVQGFSDPWLDQGVAAGELTREGLEAGEVVIGPGLARAQEVGPGDTVEVKARGGTLTFPVMGVVFNGDLGGRNVMMDFDLLQRHFGTEAPARVLVEPAAGVTNPELLAALRSADLDPGTQIRTPDELIEAVTDDIAEQLSTMDAIQRGLLVMSFIAVLSTLLLVGIQRQREFGMLAAVGMTPAELRRMILAEAGFVAVLGVLVTGVLALVQYGSLVLITPVVIGYKDPYVVDLEAMAIYGVVAVAVAFAAAWYPSRRAGKVEVLDALRYE
ncbi:MAG TPA: FtsX-like permease family protein, partial [Acidimicrobiales bacterium]|nr:FtsX-like permease family protein [Acidimicrobiales bacterium]